MSRCRPRLRLLCLLAASTACSGEQQQDPAPQRSSLPPLHLRPMVPEFEQLAATATDPNEATQRELREYADIALQLVETDPRTSALSERALLEHQSAWFVLEPGLQHDDVAVRRRAAWLCGKSGQTVLQLPLLLRLKYEPDPETAVWVADALQRLGNDTGLSWLDAAIASETTAQQAGALAIAALQERGVEVPAEPTWADLRRLLVATHEKWRASGVTTRPDCAAPDPQQLQARLAKHLLTPNGWQLRPVDDARYVMRLSGQLAVPMLERAALAEEHYIRTMPLQVLAELGPAARQAAPTILPLLADTLAAPYAVRALGEIGAADAIPHLQPLLDDPDTELRAAATEALGLLGDQDSKAALEARLADEKEVMDVRVGAAFGLLCLGEHAAGEAFLAEREANKDYHEAQLQRLRERLAAR